MRNIFIGIDPGLEGGITFVDAKRNKLSSFPTPIFKEKNTKKKIKTQYDIRGMSDLFIYSPEEVAGVYIEKVTAMPGQGVTSMFRFGYGLGLWHGIIVAKGYDYIEVTPQKWKKHYGLSSNKKESSEKASELFPQCKHLWKLVKQNGLAESALICNYGINLTENQIENPGLML